VRTEGLPRGERIRKRDEITRVLEEGERIDGAFLRAFWIREDPACGAVNRLGVAVGKRIGKAARRNLLKRRIREAYRRRKGDLPRQGVAVIFMASARMIGKGACEVEDEIGRVLRAIASSLSRASGARSSRA
jgi:ribonuclease P protein component